jgi:hypothetical protein
MIGRFPRSNGWSTFRGMSTIKKLSATSMSAAEITKVFPLTRLERLVIIQHLHTGEVAGTEEIARKRRDLYQALAKDWDWISFEEKGGLKPSDFEQEVEATLTKAQLKFLQEFAANLSGRLNGKFGYPMLDVADRVHFVLTAE